MIIRSKRKPFGLFSLVLVGAAFVFTAPALAATYQVVGLGWDSSFHALNNSGQVASAIDRQAVTWTEAGGITYLGYLSGGTRSYGEAINNLGHVVGEGRSTAHPKTYGEAFYWNGTTMTALGTLGGDNSYGYDINDSGAVTGKAHEAYYSDYHAFLWTASGGMQDLGTLGGEHSYGYAINNQNAVVGESMFDTTAIYHAFLWTASGGMQDLGAQGGLFVSEARDINDANQVVGIGNTADADYQALLWENGLMTGLGFLPDGTRSYAEGINNLGQVVGKSYHTDPGYHGFIWEDGVMTDLNDLIDPSLGWVIDEAYDINENGQILAHGVIGGDDTLVLLNPVPVPAAAWLLGSGLIGLVGLRRRSRV